MRGAAAAKKPLTQEQCVSRSASLRSGNRRRSRAKARRHAGAVALIHRIFSGNFRGPPRRTTPTVPKTYQNHL